MISRTRLTIVLAILGSAGLAVETTGCAKDAPVGPPAEEPARHTSWRRARLLIADAADRRARIFDVEDDEVTETLTVGDVARVEASESGNLGIVYLRGGNEVALVTSGVSIIDHVDHIHIYKSAPKLLAPNLSAAIAMRLVSHDGFLGLLRENENSASASATSEDSLIGTVEAGAGETPAGELPRHPGVVVPVRGHLLVTRPPSVELRSMSGALEQTLGECHFEGGVATARDHVTIACADHLLRVAFAADAGAPAVSRMAYPAGLAAPPKVLQAHHERGVMIGTAGPRQLLRVDPHGEASVITLAADACSVALEPSRGERIVVLATDGTLHDVDFATGETRRSVAVTAPFACDTESPHPHMALAPERAYVSSPATGELIDVDLRTVSIAARFRIDGAPNAIAALGLDVRNLNVAPGAAHDGFK